MLSRNQRRRADRSPMECKTARRVGMLEFLLLALVALSVGITVTMAVIDPAT